MRFRLLALGSLSCFISSVCLAQSVEYTKSLSGNLEVSQSGRVSTYDLPSAGATSIDQSLGSLVESWQFNLPASATGRSVTKADFVITLVRKSLTEDRYAIKRVEFFPQNAIPKARRAQSADELAYCKQPDAAPRQDIICPAVLPSDPELTVSAEVYVAIKKTDGEPQLSIESLNLYAGQNNKIQTKSVRIAKAKYVESALAWAKKNSAGFLQDKEQFLTRVEYVQVSNTNGWRRQENVADAPASWVNDDFRAKTKYVSQGGLEVVGK